MSRTMRRTFQWAWFLVLLPLAAAAQTEIERRAPAAPDGTVEIENVSGSVVVTAWDRAEVEVTGTLGRGVEELDFESSGSRTKIDVVLPGRGWGNGEAHLAVRVPRASAVEIELVSADATVSGVTGDVQIETVSGSVAIDGEPKSIDVETVSGEIELTGGSAKIAAVTVSGMVRLEGARGDVEAEAVSGRVEIEGEGVERARIQVVSGRIEFTGSLAPRTDFEVESHSGSVTLTIPETTSARFDVTSYSGRIRNDFGQEPHRAGRFTPESELRFTLGGGDGRVKIETFSGSVNLRRR